MSDKTIKIKGVEVSEKTLEMVTTGMCITLHASVLVDNIEKIEKYHDIYRAKTKQTLHTAKELLLKSVIELASDYDLMDKYMNAEQVVRAELNTIFNNMKRDFYETCIVPENEREAFVANLKKKEIDLDNFISLYRTATDKGKTQCLVNLKKNQK